MLGVGERSRRWLRLLCRFRFADGKNFNGWQARMHRWRIGLDPARPNPVNLRIIRALIEIAVVIFRFLVVAFTVLVVVSVRIHAEIG